MGQLNLFSLIFFSCHFQVHLIAIRRFRYLFSYKKNGQIIYLLLFADNKRSNKVFTEIVLTKVD
jgi:hypothetical protein